MKYYYLKSRKEKRNSGIFKSVDSYLAVDKTEYYLFRQKYSNIYRFETGDAKDVNYYLCYYWYEEIEELPQELLLFIIKKRLSG